MAKKFRVHCSKDVQSGGSVTSEEGRIYINISVATLLMSGSHDENIAKWFKR